MDDKAVLDRTEPTDQIGPTDADSEKELREEALGDLRKRRELGAHVLAFVLVNGFVVLIWTLTGAGFFWPAFLIVGWAIGLIFHAWDVLWPEPDEDAVRAAMDRIARRR